MSLPAQTNNSVSVRGETDAIIAVIERICLDREADPSKLEKMLDMQERVLDRNSRQAFAADFALMQTELPRVPKNGLIQIIKNGAVVQETPYAKLEDINDTVRPTLQKYGFGVSFAINQSQSSLTVAATLMHRLGHFKETTITLPIDNTGSKNAVQAVGSTTSYGKRYTLCAILNISTGDDIDGYFLKNEDKPNQAGAIAVADPTIDAKQIKKIRDALKIAGVTEERFCKSAGIEKLSDLSEWRFEGAIEHIKAQAQGAKQ